MEPMLYAKGISWIDDCRIPFVDDKDKGSVLDPITGIKGYKHTAGAMTGGIPRMDAGNPIGRFPANILVSDDMLNDGSITKQSQRTYKPTDNTASLFGNSPQAHGIGIGDKGTNSRYYDIDKWFDKIINYE